MLICYAVRQTQGQGGTVEGQGAEQGTRGGRLVSGLDKRESPAVPPRGEGGHCDGGWNVELGCSAGDAERNLEAGGSKEMRKLK